jgi:hypothetical protein
MPVQRQSFPNVILSLLLGAAYLELTLPHATLHLATNRGWNSVASAAQWSIGLNQRIAVAAPSFPDLLRYILYGVALYVGCLLLLALRHGRMDFFGWGVVTLAISTAVFHLIAWGGYLVVKIFWLIKIVLSFIGGAVAWLLGFVMRFMVFIAEALMRLLGGYWWVVAILVLAALFVIVAKHGREAVDILKVALVILVGAAVTVGVVFLLRWLWRFIEPVLMWIANAIRFLFHLIVIAFLGVCVLLAIATVGQLLLDQFRGALTAGKRRIGILIGSMAIGTSLAILLVVSNSYGVNGAFPFQVAGVVAGYVHHTAPLLDALITLTLVALSVVSVLRNVAVLGDEPRFEEFARSLVYAFVGVFVAGAITAVAAGTEDS